jgi:Neprosin
MGIDQRQLNPELSDWLEARQGALNIRKTTTTPSGQTLDWVPIESQAADGKIASPPPAHSMRARARDEKRPVRPVDFELDDPKVEQGPVGTVPIVRPDLTRLTQKISLQNFLTKKGGLKVYRRLHKAQPTDPDPAGYFHDIDNQDGTFYGWDGFLNVWDPKINNPNGAGNDHSILQVWLQNNKPPLQSLEGGWTVDQSLNGDTQPHIFTYYTTNGYSKDGDNLGGYNRLYKGWVQYSSASTTGSTVFPGIRINGLSVYRGVQTDVSMKFQLYREPTNGQLNWWVNVQGIWMGYYPASLYNGGLGDHATYVGCGGEVYSSLAKPEQTQDQMGSGRQAAGGWTEAAFLRNLRNQADLNGTMVNNDGTASRDVATKGGADPYTIQMDMDSATTWGSYFYVGGPAPAPAMV